MDESSNGRTHEPSLRETVAELDGLRDLLQAQLTSLKDILDERDKLYTERDGSRSKAVEAALVSVKEQTKASFDASEKAIVKAEDAQKAYNTAHNDLARKMDEQNKATIPRMETEQRFHSMEEKIGELRDYMTGTIGKGKGYESVWGWIVAAAGSGGVLAWIASHYNAK